LTSRKFHGSVCVCFITAGPITKQSNTVRSLAHSCRKVATAHVWPALPPRRSSARLTADAPTSLHATCDQPQTPTEVVWARRADVGNRLHPRNSAMYRISNKHLLLCFPLCSAAFSECSSTLAPTSSCSVACGGGATRFSAASNSAGLAVPCSRPRHGEAGRVAGLRSRQPESERQAADVAHQLQHPSVP
jgi:hypothetical protein